MKHSNMLNLTVGLSVIKTFYFDHLQPFVISQFICCSQELCQTLKWNSGQLQSRAQCYKTFYGRNL